MTATRTAGAGPDEPILLAFSGGLDTSFCVPWLKDTYQPAGHHRHRRYRRHRRRGGGRARRALRATGRDRASSDRRARPRISNQVLKFLIMGNVRRGGFYPLCVGAERVLQAQTIAQMALSLKTTMVAHGCTAAGNDQVRFEVALRTLAPDLTIIAPVRDRAFKRPEQLKYLRGPRLADPAVRRGLFGEPRLVGRHHRRQGNVDLGGKHSRERLGAVEGRVLAPARAGTAHASASRAGVPSSLDGKPSKPVAVIEQLESLAGPFGIGRGIHLGDTVIGTKGRVAFEAPAADVLLTAHRELEKLVLTGKQARIKESVAQPYGDLVHEGQHLDPVCRDIEALLDVIAGARHAARCSVLLRPGSAFIEGVTSPAFVDGRLQRRLRRSRRRVDADRCARIFEDAGADRHFLPAGAAPRRRRNSHERHAHGGGRQDRLGHPGPRAHPRDPHRAGDSLRGRRGHRGRDPQQQVDLQHPGTDQRAHGQSRARRHRGRRARTSQGPVRLFRPHSRRRSSRAT